MEPELQRAADEQRPVSTEAAPASPQPAPWHERDFDWVFIGPNGLRAGWAILLFAGLYYLFREVVGTLFFAAGLIHDTSADSAGAVLGSEFAAFLSLVPAALIMILLEDRRVLSYNLGGPRRVGHFFSGLFAGFIAISLLVAGLALGGWMHVAPATLTAPEAVRLGALWIAVFLIVASVEEGLFRCYALSTLTRGINFWWALAAQIGLCCYLALDTGHNGAPGVYLAAAIGLFPCLILNQKLGARSAFWQAAWVTSTFFGFYHTSNTGENWIGVFAAAAIGFVFCVSVFVTGSVWWAVGCHTGWDWAETFIYGTADSGQQGQGHLFSAAPTGNPLWSGGSDGPEGSLLVVGAILLLLLVLAGFYGRNKSTAFTASSQPAG
jgi:membrane protease YdiL (CAAX protease family)